MELVNAAVNLTNQPLHDVTSSQFRMSISKMYYINCCLLTKPSRRKSMKTAMNTHRNSSEANIYLKNDRRTCVCIAMGVAA